MTQVDATLTAEATTSSWLLPGAFNTDASELTDVPNTMVGRRVKKFFPGKGWFEGTVTSTSAGTGGEGAEKEQTFARRRRLRTAKPTRNGVVPPPRLGKSGNPFRKAWGSHSGSTRDGRQPHTRRAQHEPHPERLETALLPY